ncbi:MAG: hypothetical protein WCP45_10140, partial [Verrucomicrobiota bacterium]
MKGLELKWTTSPYLWSKNKIRHDPPIPSHASKIIRRGNAPVRIPGPFPERNSPCPSIGSPRAVPNDMGPLRAGGIGGARR